MKTALEPQPRGFCENCGGLITNYLREPYLGPLCKCGSALEAQKCKHESDDSGKKCRKCGDEDWLAWMT